MKPTFRWQRSIYAIIAFILLMAVAMQLAHSQSMIRWNRHLGSGENRQTWKPSAPMPETVPEGPPYCLLHDSGEPFSQRVTQQASRVLAYMKKPAHLFDVTAGTFLPDGCVAVIVTFSQLDRPTDWEPVVRWAEAGGRVFVAVRPEPGVWLDRLSPFLGIINDDGVTDEKGIRLIENVLIGATGLEFDETFLTNTVNRVVLAENARILATTSGGVPLLWLHPYGRGAFMVFNGTILQEKLNRGLMAGAVSMLEPDFIYPVFNARVMYIDDFPAPFPQGTDPAIYEAYRRDLPRFYRDIWWPDMRKAAAQYRFKYTAALIQSYNNRVEPPFSAPAEEDPRNLIMYAREVLRSGGEIGLHGYNHQSLQTDRRIAEAFGYRVWTNVDHMTAAVSEALRYFARAFPDYTLTVYVPPSNVLDATGREALRRAWPSLAIIASLYPDDANGLAYVQEFEVARDGILEMPRFTSGYAVGPFEQWVTANAVTAHGMFSHFVHPDDVLDKERSEVGNWERLYERFSAFLSWSDRLYPWLRSLTATEAGMEVERTLAARVKWNRENGRWRGDIAPYSGPLSFVLRTEARIGPAEVCEIRRIDNGVYLVTAQAPTFSFRLDG